MVLLTIEIGKVGVIKSAVGPIFWFPNTDRFIITACITNFYIFINLKIKYKIKYELHKYF